MKNTTKNGKSPRLYVGNLPYDMTTDRLVSAFAEHGFSVSKPVIVTDKETGQSRGFGFVSLDGGLDAQVVVEAMDGAQVDGRTLRVDRAHERQ